MRFLPAVVCALLLLPVPAEAQQTNAPPGNSGIDQYLETVPSGSGNRRVERKPGGTQGISPATRRALEAEGTEGRLAADLAAAGAPADGPSKGSGGSNGSGSGSAAPGSGSTGPRLRDEPAASPVQAVVEAVTGSTGESGMGPLLPVLLALALVSMLGVALLRRRSNG